MLPGSGRETHKEGLLEGATVQRAEGRPEYIITGPFIWAFVRRAERTRRGPVTHSLKHSQRIIPKPLRALLYAATVRAVCKFMNS